MTSRANENISRNWANCGQEELMVLSPEREHGNLCADCLSRSSGTR
jgi:hypothetical protein